MYSRHYLSSFQKVKGTVVLVYKTPQLTDPTFRKPKPRPRPKVRKFNVGQSVSGLKEKTKRMPLVLLLLSSLSIFPFGVDYQCEKNLLSFLVSLLSSRRSGSAFGGAVPTSLMFFFFFFFFWIINLLVRSGRHAVVTQYRHSSFGPAPGLKADFMHLAL